MRIHGYEHVHREEIRIGPDGKPVRNVYTLTRELNEKQATELMEEQKALFAPMERMFAEMDGVFGRLFAPFGGMFHGKPERKGRK